jgi:hypothetical protein
VVPTVICVNRPLSGEVTGVDEVLLREQAWTANPIVRMLIIATAMKIRPLVTATDGMFHHHHLHLSCKEVDGKRTRRSEI